MRTSILAYIIAVVGLVMLTFGAWGLFVLNTAEIDIALTDEAIVFGPNRRRPCNDRSGTSPAPATRYSEKYQSSLGGSLKRKENSYRRGALSFLLSLRLRSEQRRASRRTDQVTAGAAGQ